MKYINLEYHPNDSRMRIADDEVCQSLTQRMGTGGNNVPLVLAVGIDSYNQMAWEEVAPSLRANEGGDTKPKVLVVRDADSSWSGCVQHDADE